MKKLVYLYFAGVSYAGFSQESKAECPMGHGSTSKSETTERRETLTSSFNNQDWWPNRLSLEVLRQNSEKIQTNGIT